MALKDKLKSAEELASIVADLKSDGKRVVFTNGCFDLMHGGHISYLEGARVFGDALVVGINSDESVQKLKGPQLPILPESERAEILAAMEMVDYVVIFGEPKCERLLEMLRPDVHAKGTDYTKETYPEHETAERLGIEIAITGAPKQNATRDIIKKIRESGE